MRLGVESVRPTLWIEVEVEVVGGEQVSLALRVD